MKLANTLCLAINDLHADHQTTTAAPVYWFNNGRLIVSGWLVWNGGHDYTSRYHREIISPNRQHVMQVVRGEVVVKAPPTPPVMVEPVLEVAVEPPMVSLPEVGGGYDSGTLTFVQSKTCDEVKSLWSYIREFAAKLGIKSIIPKGPSR